MWNWRPYQQSESLAASGSTPLTAGPRPCPWKRRAGNDGAWGSRELTILLGGRRLARTEKSVGALTVSRRKQRRRQWRRRPSYARRGRLRPSGRPRGKGGCRLGEGKRRRGERAGRGDWTRGSWRGEEKLRSRFRDGERGRRLGEKWRQSREGGGGEGGQAARGLQPRTRARARTRAVTDSLQWLALTRNLKARKRGRAGEGGESGAQRRAGRRAGARAEPAAGAGLPRAPHIREPAHPLGGGRAALCRALVGERGARRPPLRARRGERGGGGADVSDVAWWSPSCHVAGGGRGGGLKRGRLSRERETRKYEGSL